MNALRRWLVMAILCFASGIIFMLPFLREAYYIPMQDAFGYTNTEMGVLMSVFGAVSLLSYFPGGWIADRYSPRKLMASGLLGMGLGGLYFSTFPSYQISIAIHAFWGVCGGFVFWGAMIKATRNWAPPKSQGQAFGILESGRGVAELASSSIFFYLIFVQATDKTAGLAQVITMFAITNIVLAILAWFILDDTVADANGGQGEGNEEGQDKVAKVGLNEIITVLKLPEVWLIGTVVLTAYSAYWGSFYFAPYATDAYGLSVVLGVSVGVARMWVKPLSALTAGLVADKIGVARSVLACFILMTVCFLGFAILPGGESYLIVMLVNVFFVSIAIYAIRGIYFALLEEGGIAKAVTGTAAGVISAVGFTPDIFMPLLGGILLDAYPGALGYRYYFLVITCLCVIGTIAAFILMRRATAKKATYLNA